MPLRRVRVLKIILMEYKVVFAWSYKEMTGLDPKVVVHHLSVRHGIHPIKQSHCRFHLELISQIEVQVSLRGQVFNLDCRHCSSKKEEWTNLGMF